MEVPVPDVVETIPDNEDETEVEKTTPEEEPSGDAEPENEPEMESKNEESTECNPVSSVELTEESNKMESTSNDEPIEENSADRTAESPTTGDNNLWSSTKCVYCKQVLTGNDEPKLLECLHSACGACVKSKMNEIMNLIDSGSSNSNSKGVQVISCGLCKIVCRQTQIIDNRFLTELVTEESTETNNKVEDLKCNSCSDNDIATSWCVECSEYICNKCVQAHKR